MAALSLIQPLRSLPLPSPAKPPLPCKPRHRCRPSEWRLFLSPPQSISPPPPLSRRHRGYNVAIPNTSGQQPPLPPKLRARDAAATVIVSFKNRRRLRRQRHPRRRTDSFFAPPPYPSLGRSTRTPLGLTIRGEDRASATHSLPPSASRSPLRTTHMLFTISQ